MKRIRPQAAQPLTTERRDFLAGLHVLMTQAATVFGLTDAVQTTAHVLINRIPHEAPEPISPASVTSLAEQRGVDPRTIRNHIAALIETGLARNACLDGGRRHTARDRRGAITELYGIDFAPMMQRADEIEALDADRKAELAEQARFRFEISKVRKEVRRMVEAGHLDDDQLSVWASLPRRIAHMTHAALERLWTVVCALRDALTACGEVPPLSEKISDRSEKSDRPYSTHQALSDCCNPPMASEKKTGATCGLEHITLHMVKSILPLDWEASILRHYQTLDWNSFANTAYERAAAAGISPAAWAAAQAAIGRHGAAIMVLIALTDAAGNGGKIANPGGWVRRMAERAERGTAHLHRSMFGLMERANAA
ncbi:replication initiation protein RepC (plasmid) [Acuticoccus sp. MNP-M23]|uniref:replication initiation protein RepC n=1 Tax=Acuticoccus sp. MNP-M23 TaxID=3072793 RepID=UPI002814AD94|nr:replication initiation protein RepC [Acuticoccus sp. MNP-M23]WMS45217.1 replication initiation protein RepC [Acuticoccus sp. MNP-M23]